MDIKQILNAKILSGTFAICIIVTSYGKQQNKEHTSSLSADIATNTILSDTLQAVRNTLTDIYSQVQQMARSGKFDTTPLTLRYCTQEFKDLYQREVKWTQENEDMLISYNCWLRLQDSESPTYTIKEIELFEHQEHHRAMATIQITDTLGGTAIAHRFAVHMTLTNGKWLVSDFQDFNEPTYTEVLKLALEEAEASIK